MSNLYQSIRQRSFQKAMPMDAELLELIDDDRDNQVLANPPLHSVYLYLVDYICAFSRHWFKRGVSDIRFLDWGCGKGHITYFLNKHGAMVTSADRYDESDDSAFGQSIPVISKTDITVIRLQHDYLLPFDDQKFDVVISMGVLEHVPNEIASLHEINRVLRPDGLFFCFFLPYTWSWTQRLAHLRGNYYHDRLYSESKIKTLLAATDFSLLDYWHRQLLPKNTIRYPKYHLVEKIDQWFTHITPLKYLATNIEFIASKI